MKTDQRVLSEADVKRISLIFDKYQFFIYLHKKYVQIVKKANHKTNHYNCVYK